MVGSSIWVPVVGSPAAFAAIFLQLKRRVSGRLRLICFPVWAPLGGSLLSIEGYCTKTVPAFQPRSRHQIGPHIPSRNSSSQWPRLSIQLCFHHGRLKQLLIFLPIHNCSSKQNGFFLVSKESSSNGPYFPSKRSSSKADPPFHPRVFLQNGFYFPSHDSFIKTACTFNPRSCHVCGCNLVFVDPCCCERSFCDCLDWCRGAKFLNLRCSSVVILAPPVKRCLMFVFVSWLLFIFLVVMPPVEGCQIRFFWLGFVVFFSWNGDVLSYVSILVTVTSVWLIYFRFPCRRAIFFGFAPVVLALREGNC